MSEYIAVVGTGRSGTSAIGGILHRLGVSMGIKFNLSTPQNQYGTFEEKEFFDTNRKFINGEYIGTNMERWLAEYVERREKESSPWGLKDPLLYITMPLLERFGGARPRVVIAQRDRWAAINSYMFAYHAKLHDAKKWYDEAAEDINVLRQMLDSSGQEYLVVDYDKLFDDPVSETWRIAKFALGESFDDKFLVNYAASHIKTGGRKFLAGGRWSKKVSHPREDGWGTVAIGARIAKFPDFNFFTSWTAMLTGGTRRGDSVLMPVGWLPAHWAANALARDFLRTDKDSLLMLDDDMSFDENSLELLRSNKENWDYDIVFGFCTHRVWPPKPVVLQRVHEDVGKPESLHGSIYKTMNIVPDNSVIEVDAVGLAFTLIKRHVIEAMTEEYGPMFTFYFTYGQGFESDDIPFCEKAKDLGFKIAVDTNVKIGHVGQSVFGWNEYNQWAMQQRRPDVVEFNASDLVPILNEAMPHLVNTKDAAKNVLGYLGVHDDRG